MEREMMNHEVWAEIERYFQTELTGIEKQVITDCMVQIFKERRGINPEELQEITIQVVKKILGKRR